MLKKAMTIACLSTLLVGCAGGEEKVMTCTQKQSLGTATMEMEMEFTYTGDTAKSQHQESVITATSDSAFESLVDTFADMDFESKIEDMDGATYELNVDEDALEITEILDVDFAKISGEDYSIVTNGQSNATKISIKKTKESLEDQGMTCS